MTGTFMKMRRAIAAFAVALIQGARRRWVGQRVPGAERLRPTSEDML
jgi:hypothetical protein